jgi:DNA primase
MPVIKATSVRDLKLRVNVVDVVSRVATLRKAGARYKGLCPFHQEKTPSFHVDPDKGFYKCFGCGKAGDIITFVRETEQLSFTEAVETLAQRHGVVIEYEEGSGPSREERSLRQELFELHEFATDHFHQAFRAEDDTGRFLRDYWTRERRFAPEIAEEFRIGGANAAGSDLGAALMRRRFSEQAIRQCGLFFIRDDALLTPAALRPRFRGRLIIPIRDHQGRVVAFTARQTSLTPADDPAHEAKYVNSPETPIFTKGNLLFGLDRARSKVGEGHPFVLVEGQLDAIRCWSVGLRTAVAPQGTAITEAQLLLLRRYHPEIECFFDSDSAGQKAALRLIPLALRAGIEVRLLGSGSGVKMDPDALLADGGLSAYEQLRATAVGSMAYFVRCIEPEPERASPERLQRDQEQVFDLILQSESKATQEMLLAEAGRHLRATSARFREDFMRHAARAGSRAGVPAAPAGSGTAGTVNRSAEHQLLYLCLHYPDMRSALARALPHEWVDPGSREGALLNRLLADTEAHGLADVESLLEDEEERRIVADFLFESPRADGTYRDLGDPRGNAEQALTELRRRALEPRLRQIELDLAKPPADSNADAISLLKELADLRRQLQQPIGLPVVV